jgi:radical SAM protein with 4Fe4S-binding SPASM domain
VTRRCNARCPFCFYLEKKGDREKAPELSLEEIRGVASSMENLLWLAFSGGEVYLREDIAEIAGVFYRHNRPSIILLPTNGLAPALIREKTEEILRACPESVVAVKLSLDGPENLHDAMRGTPGGFDRVMETYEALGGLIGKYRNFELGINTLFCSENQDRMDEIIEFVKSLEMIRTHTISMVRGELREETYKDIDAEKYLDAIGRLERGLKDGSSPTYGFGGARIKAAQDIIQRRLIHRTLKEKRRLLPCHAGRLNVVLTETGDVYPCESFREEHRMGNIREHGLDMGKALRGERAKEVKSSIKGGCFCTHECYMMTNILFNPRMYPELLKETLLISRA